MYVLSKNIKNIFFFFLSFFFLMNFSIFTAVKKSPCILHWHLLIFLACRREYRTQRNKTKHTKIVIIFLYVKRIAYLAQISVFHTSLHSAIHVLAS